MPKYFLFVILVNFLLPVAFPITPYAYDKKSQNFAQGLDFLSFQVAIYTVFHEESESEVEKCHFLRPEAKNTKN